MTAYLAPVGLLFVSNIFMTFAWYGQLGAVSRPVWLAVLIAWGIAFFEYCLVIPANRIGYGGRKRVGYGKSVSVGVHLGGRRLINKTTDVRVQPGTITKGTTN